MYWDGDGVAQNHIMAYYWASIAAANDPKIARTLRDPIASEMTRQQIAEAQRMAAAFKPRTAADHSGSPKSHSIISEPDAYGSGFFITSDGHFVTNHHVVEGASRIRVHTASGTHAATIVRQDAANDLAILKVEGTFPALHVRGSTDVRAADRVATVGYPNLQLQGATPKYSSGDVAAVTGPNDDPRFFQISVPVQPGNSGGPLVDEFGNVVGVVVGQLDKAVTLQVTGQLPENVNYAIKGTLLLSLLESVPNLGSSLVLKPNNASREGSVVAKFVSDSTGMVIVFK